MRRYARLSAKALAIMRCAIGVSASICPSLAAAPWVGAEESARPSIRVFGQTLGARDLALGAGTLGADSDTALARITTLGAFADDMDFVATLKDFSHPPRLERLLVLGSTFGACTIGLIAATQLQGVDGTPAEAITV